MIETVYSAKRKTHSLLKGKHSMRCHFITWTSHTFLQNLRSFISTGLYRIEPNETKNPSYYLPGWGCLFLDFFSLSNSKLKTDRLTVSASVWLCPGRGWNLSFIQTAQIRALMPLNAAGRVSPFVSHINKPNRLQCWLSDCLNSSRCLCSAVDRLTLWVCGWFLHPLKETEDDTTHYHTFF